MKALTTLSSSDVVNIRKVLLAWYQANDRSLPWRLLWLAHRNPYHVWLSEIMLQQTVIKAVIPSYDRFLQCFPTLDSLAQAEPEAVALAARGLGYYRRFRLMQKAAILVVARGHWPQSFDEWLSLPGIGPYTAGAISSICNGENRPAVDGNVERIMCRWFNIPKPVNDPSLKPLFKKIAAQLVDPLDPGGFNQALMELGQLICRQSKPQCDLCPTRSYCQAHKAKTQNKVPLKKGGAQLKTQVKMAIVIPCSARRVGLCQRNENSYFLSGIPGFPLAFQLQDTQTAPKLNQSWPLEGLNLEQKLGEFTHVITHHRIQAEVYLASPDKARAKDLAWVEADLAHENLVASLDQKALKTYFAVTGAM